MISNKNKIEQEGIVDNDKNNKWKIINNRCWKK